MSRPAGRSRGPGRLSVLLAVGGVLGGGVSALLGNVAGNLLSELSVQVLGSASVGVVVLGLLASFLVEWRRRRRDQLAEPDETDAEAPAAAGPPTLPYPAGFTGRDDEVQAVVDELKQHHAVAVVGRRAVGTSWCAIQAANLCRAEFPDGLYHLDLRRGGRRRSARQVLAALARILGTRPPASGRPDDLAHAADEVRRQLDGRRILLVLDNVDDPAQVRPLLPPTARTCRLLLAGTGALAASQGVAAHWLGEPDTDDAVELFAAAGAAAPAARPHRPDPRTDPAVRDIVELCGRQPRTVAELGRRTAQHGWRHADVLDALRRAVGTPPHQEIDASPATLLVTARDTAYHALSAEARRLWRLMSLSPAPVDRPTIAALADRRPDRVAALLDELAAGAFVVGAPGDRYEVRPLLGPYARMHLRDDEPVRRRVAAQARLTRHLARRADRHVASLAVAASTLDRDRPLPLDDDPYGWFDLHQELLLAVVKVPAGAAETLPRRVRRWWFRLAVALCGWLAHVERLDEWDEVCRTVLATPTADDRPEIAGWAHNELGVLRRRRHDPQGAATALTLAVAERGRRGTAQARMNLGLVLLDLGQLDDAVEHLELSRRHRSSADRAGHALTQLGLGAAQLARGELEIAHHHLVRAANTFRSLGDARGYAAALTNLVLVHAEMGEHLDAAQSWRAALREYESVADPTNRAAALLNAGATLLGAAPGQARQAYEMLAESRRLREGGPATPGLGRTLLYLGDAAAALGDPDEARRHWVDAAAICEAARDAEGQAEADARLAGVDAPADEPA
ncbi:tetratricopeptide repeat protein [Micromonospora sp. C28SCA-DRY-2]|uniref:tetratricopeptide repeat protein n=1 Tax=Micromonospora sp. C28SCA-DRY-2 TaxID=3059522 RepID=UPI0026769B03|nr:tetratricopeptide repeat protein [Micromonospora sp. C28SCA-DRY-2]MDO3704931.1 tetratricopeptide repeat protein [Micromonospora sp. C28SCA-DRY-2]